MNARDTCCNDKSSIMWGRLLFIAVNGFIGFGTAHAGGIWGTQNYSEFCAGLRPASREVLRESIKDFLPAIESRSEINPKSIRVARFEDIDPILDRAARQGLSTLDVFTQAELAGPGACAFILDSATLGAIDAKYKLNSVWVIAGPRSRNGLPTVRMNYLLAGEGHLVVGYSDTALVDVDDGKGAYHQYRYEPYIASQIVNSGSTRGLFNLKALSSPNGELKPFEGPHGAEIHSFQLKGNEVLVRFTWGLDQETLARKDPIQIRPPKVAQTQSLGEPL